MTWEDVLLALEKGTVIFNSAGAHIPKLAGATLACVDGTILPNALNLYVTAPGKRTSAPPHTDKQDVVVVQTSGSKHWRVYSPPSPNLYPYKDMFARGKGNDDLPLYHLESPESGSELLLETTLQEGDVLFVPAGFPHTTDTANHNDKMSISMTFGLDTHIWSLDYLAIRRWAYKRAGRTDYPLYPNEAKEESPNPYVGPIHLLPSNLHADLLDALPMGFVENPDDVKTVVEKSQELARQVNALPRNEQVSSGTETAEKDEDDNMEDDADIWKETTERIQKHGKDLFEIHRDMYLAAIQEGQTRLQEKAMTAHLTSSESSNSARMRQKLTNGQVHRLSFFRVKRYFEMVEKRNAELNEWSTELHSADNEDIPEELPEDWALTMPVHVGDEVEADLGGAFFPARVTKIHVAGTTKKAYDVQFFDGDFESGLSRDQVKLVHRPVAAEKPPSNLTGKQLKRWKKEQAKKKKKKTRK